MRHSMAPIPSPSPPPTSRIWALLIGIENYPDPRDAVAGSSRDVDNMVNYLLGRGVSMDCIVILKDKEATREVILKAWESHLINNEAIERDDPMLVYFSGHGGFDDSPTGWPVDGPNNQTELLIAYDSLAPDEDSGQTYAEPEWSIPDRTIAALLRKTAKRHSSNITLIFDCCHSAHMSRNAPRLPPDLIFTKRGIAFDPRSPRRRLKKLSADTDKRIWFDPEAEKELAKNLSNHRGLYFSRQNDTHVLLAACTRKQESTSNSNGGLFTRALLLSLAETEDISYDKLLERIHYHLGCLRRDAIAAQDAWAAEHHILVEEYMRPGVQTPQCEGTNRSRLLWRKTGDSVRSYTVMPYEPGPDGAPRCQIDVGTDAGIRQGTVFQVSSTTPRRRIR
jgi:hypothetical protein